MKNKFLSLISTIGLFYAAAIWGSTFFIVKDSLQSINAVLLVAYRFLLASGILAIYLLFKKAKLFDKFWYGAILGLFLWLLYVPQTIGLKITSSANSGFITGLFVVFVPIFSYLFFRQKPSRNKLIAVGLSVAGLFILTGGLKSYNYGDVITLITAMAYAIHILLADKFVKKKLNPFVLTFQQFFVVGVLSLVTSFLFSLPFSFGGINVLYTLIFLAIFPTLSAFAIQMFAQKTVSATKVSLIFALEPVFAAIFAWTLGNELFVVTQAFGGALIVAGMMVSELS
jgi:drug/metabolite transporter (DMT)-like permease